MVTSTCLRAVVLAAIAPTLVGTSAAQIGTAEMRYTHLVGNTYQLDVLAYTCLDGPWDLPELVVDMGDGDQDTLPRISIVDGPSNGCCTSRFSIYSGPHTYAAQGPYVIAFQYGMRNSDLLNVPGAASEAFSLTATLVVTATTEGSNSPRFLSGPLDAGYSWSTLVHDLDPYDPDGDSLAFDLVVPLGTDHVPIAGYAPPTSDPPGWTWLDPENGQFHWHMPSGLGPYSLAIRAREYRNGQFLGEVVRDMTLCVNELPNGSADLVRDAMPLVRPTMTAGPVWITNSTNRSLELVVEDLNGRRVHAGPALPGEQFIDLGHLSAGSYLLRFARGRPVRIIRE